MDDLLPVCSDCWVNDGEYFAAYVQKVREGATVVIKPCEKHKHGLLQRAIALNQLQQLPQEEALQVLRRE